MSELSAEDLKAIDVAVRAQRGRLNAEERWDLRQELAIKLLQKRPEGDVANWLVVCARNWTANYLRGQARYRELIAEVASGVSRTGSCSRSVRGRFAPRSARDPDLWEPTWYKPHPSASEYNPFALKGARIMYLKPGQKKSSNS